MAKVMIKIEEQTRGQLQTQFKGFGDTYDKVINRLLQEAKAKKK